MTLALRAGGLIILATHLQTPKAPWWRSHLASDQDRFDIAYEAFHGLSDDLYTIDTTQPARGVTSDDAPGVPLRNEPKQLKELVHLPRNWPLARLTIPLGGLSKQVDRLLEGYCFQILRLTAIRMYTMGRFLRQPHT